MHTADHPRCLTTVDQRSFGRPAAAAKCFVGLMASSPKAAHQLRSSMSAVHAHTWIDVCAVCRVFEHTYRASSRNAESQ
jgi:hypothetical protein